MGGIRLENIWEKSDDDKEVEWKLHQSVVHPSLVKMSIFIDIHGPGCVCLEVADETYPCSEGSGAVGAG